MATVRDVNGIDDLWSETIGDPRVNIALIDGPADLSHPCFDGANVKVRNGSWFNSSGRKCKDEYIEHATWVLSVILGQPVGEAEGIAPRCTGINVPLGYEEDSLLNPHNLVHAISLAVAEGANIIHIAVCHPSCSGNADPMVVSAIRQCVENNILVVAPVGNDKGKTLCSPAMIPGVLAVGATGIDMKPIDLNNWKGIYQEQGVLALGEDMTAAAPGGGTATHRGTSCAAPVVTGVAALLMSIQLEETGTIDAPSIRDAILETAVPCLSPEINETMRCMRGNLNIQGAMQFIRRSSHTEEARFPYEIRRLHESHGSSLSLGEVSASNLAEGSGVVASSKAASKHRLLFPIGLVGYDFGTEARRDTFKQLMLPALFNPQAGQRAVEPYIGQVGITTEQQRQKAAADLRKAGFVEVPANPFNTVELVAHLRRRPDEAKSLIWTLNLELTPVYAIEPSGSYGPEAYSQLVDILEGQSLVKTDGLYIERASIPGVLSGRSVRLFNGQVVPAYDVDSSRGIYAWRTNQQVASALRTAGLDPEVKPGDPQWYLVTKVRQVFRNILNKLYYQYRNLGETSPDRALNYAATNAFQLAQVLGQAILGSGPDGSDEIAAILKQAAGEKDKTKQAALIRDALGAFRPRELASVAVGRSPFCRMGSDCWDVQFQFFDPENTRRALQILRFTIDVSDKHPVSLGDIVEWSAIAGL